MFCPQCKAEYVPGFNRCSDCELDLVESLPIPVRRSDEDLHDKSLRGVWEGDDQDECVSICKRLRTAGIPFKVNQHRRQYLKGLERSFKICVPANFLSDAEEIIGEGHLDFTDKGKEQLVMELPDEDGVVTAHEMNDSSRDRANWRSEDATIEVWSENIPKHARMIESSLRENHVHVRVEVLKNDSRKIFVVPSDESRAREIVQEIKDGTPPK
jgi:hypothetical protein